MSVLVKTSKIIYDRQDWKLIKEKRIFGVPVERSVYTKDSEVRKFLGGILEINKFCTLERITSVAYSKKFCSINFSKNRQNQVLYYAKKATIENCFLDYKSWILASKIHDKSFSQYKNFYKDKIVYLIATGPSLNDFVPPNKNNDVIFVGVNKAVNFKKVMLDHLFVKDFNGFAWFEDILNYKGNNCKKFFGITANNMLNCSIPAYALSEEDCFFVVKDYHDEGFPNDISIEPLADHGSTVFSALQFILYTSPKEIRLVGCDCSSGYFHGSNQNKQSTQHSGLLLSWLKFRDYVHLAYPFIKLTSINPIGLKGVFDDFYQLKQ